MNDGEVIQGVFVTPDAAGRALRQLRDRGIGPGQVDLVSSTPMHELAPFLSLKRSPAFAIAMLGGALGALIGYLLAALTARAWPLETGAMPIVAPFTVGITVFETTALVAIISTAGALLYGAGLLRSKGHLVDTSVLKEHPDGSIVIAVLCRTAGQRTEAAKILHQV